MTGERRRGGSLMAIRRRCALAALLALIVGQSCSSDTGLPSRELRSPSATADSFFAAAAAADQAAVSRFSNLPEYPLVTGWLIRRATEPDTAAQVDLAEAHAHSAALEDRISSLSDSLARTSGEVRAVEAARATSVDKARLPLERAERSYESARSRWIKSGGPSEHKTLTPLYVERERARAEFDRVKAQHEAQYGRREQLLRGRVEALEGARKYWVAERKRQLYVLEVISESFGRIELSGKVTLLMSSMISDIEVPSEGGIGLTKKCMLSLVRASARGLEGRWVIVELKYLQGGQL